MLAHVIESISPASAAHAEGARLRVTAAGAGVLERLAAALGGAQHAATLRVARRAIVVVAGDHGCGDPGILLGAEHPTARAARAIADGTAALVAVARTSTTSVVLVDAGMAERAHAPPTAITVGAGPSGDLARGAALDVDAALRGLEAGIALALSLAEPGGGLDVVALGALGVGAEVASAALLGAATGTAPRGLRDVGAEAAGALGAARHGAPALDLLVAFGGPDTAVLAGLILGAASLDAAILLDGHATGAAALVACALAPAARGYLVAAHGGAFTQPAILAHLGLAPLFEVGLGHGDGTGAAMALPLVLQVAALAAGYNQV